MRNMVTTKCFNNGLTGRKLIARNQLKEYQKIVYDVIEMEKYSLVDKDINKVVILVVKFSIRGHKI